MAHVLVRQRVKDYSSWRSVFDGMFNTRLNRGEQGCRVFSNGEDELMVLFEWDSVQKAEMFLDSDEFRKPLEDAGAQVAESELLHEVHPVRRSAAD